MEPPLTPSTRPHDIQQLSAIRENNSRCRDRAGRPGTTTRETLVEIHFLAIGGDRSLRPHVIDHWYEGIRNVTHMLPEKKTALNCHGPGMGISFLGSLKTIRTSGGW